MWNSSKSRINIARKRYNFRQDITYKHIIIFLSISLLGLGTLFTVNHFKNKENIITSVNIYKEDTKNSEDENKDKNKEYLIPKDTKDNPNETPNQTSKDKIKFTILGEIMMGGNVTKNLSYSYSLAFKDIYSDTRMSDFTYATLATPITSLDKISTNAKSKYLVTKDIINGFSALGIDALSIATDHMLDFDEVILKNTITTLENNKISVAGRKDTPVYLEKDGFKIAIVSANNVFIGTSSKYTKKNINIYNKNTLKSDIELAKQNADFVLVDFHWGRENTYGVTSQMTTIARNAINYGADMVIGSHALGVYPIVTYKNKPIIYSTGMLISDSNINVAKESFIFDVIINKEAKVERIELTPTYINEQKEVLKYETYDDEKKEAYLEQFNKWHIDNKLNSKNSFGKIIIEF